jgi:outer membrane scaffolding protein for murein synthesis (MipA/OmpV family)
VRRLIALLAAAASAGALAVERPLWEAGLGAAALSFPHYRGSDERNDWLLPAPYFVYRGKVLRADERRIRGLFYESGGIEADISINGTPPVKSGENTARRGMPGLDATFEIGPSLNFSLARSARTRLQLRLPLRAVIASDFSEVDRVGWLLQPQLALDVRDVLPGWNAGLQLGALFSDRRYNRYFYGVDAAQAIAGRPAYEATGGYGGVQAIAALSRRFPAYWVGAFAKWDSLSGATYADSPLVRTRHHLSGGIAIAWILGKSSTSVDWFE